MVETRIGVIRPARDEDGDAVLVLDGLEDRATLLLKVGLEVVQGVEGLAVGVIALVLGDAEARPPSVEHAPRRQIGLTKGQRRVQVLDAPRREEVDLLRERRFHDLGTARHDGAALFVHQRAQETGHLGQDREEDVVERLALVGLVLVEEQVVDVGLRDLRGETRVDGAVLAALDPELFGGLFAEDDVLLRHPEGLEVGPKIGSRRVHVQDAGHPDPHSTHALAGFRSRAFEGPGDHRPLDAEETLAQRRRGDR